ncbi:MAG: thiamine pyrophosphate-dependent enzyme [Bacteroidia bacterium]
MPDNALESLAIDKDTLLADYRLVYMSRQASLMGRKEVLTGKAKFGIFGDGKELAQIALSKVFKHGDFRSGYYRDQTWAMATGVQNLEVFFAQLYADPNNDTNTRGRQMNGHFSSTNLNPDGSWRALTEQYNSFTDASPTAIQMPRMAGLVQASVLYRKLESLGHMEGFSKGGNEVIFGTIGNASAAEGHFWETLNAIGVIGGPLVMSMWDDGYGISVPNEIQVTKDNWSEVLAGFQREGDGPGYELFQVKGWDYEGLVETYQKAVAIAREKHVPCLIHVVEVTQPQGHSTSGSHERYKSKDRLAWEQDHDCLTKFRAYIVDKGIISEDDLAAMEKAARREVAQTKKAAYEAYQNPIKADLAALVGLLGNASLVAADAKPVLDALVDRLTKLTDPLQTDLWEAMHEAQIALRKDQHLDEVQALNNWKNQAEARMAEVFNTHLYSENSDSALAVSENPASFDADAEELPGFQILNRCFDAIFERDPRAVAFGEDVGFLGDVNQGFAGLQVKYGEDRIFDTGIREATIMGQAIGLAARGLRPIAEIQYLDYFLYGLQLLSDDLASLRYRSANTQKAPAIIRTRGHRLEGVWHSGSPLGMMINALRGMHILVPRNMVQAAGFYNTLFQSEEPAVVIEVLNGYRLKERCPSNLDTFTVPLGVPETLQEGNDLTLVTYGACCHIAQTAANQLSELGVSVEIIDVQSLLPFDVNHHIVESLKKTNRLLVLDEDVPGGASAYILQEILETQNGYYHLDSPPVTLTSKAHRPAFGTDGDYFSKPQVEHVVKAAYGLMHDADPTQYPVFW